MIIYSSCIPYHGISCVFIKISELLFPICFYYVDIHLVYISVIGINAFSPLPCLSKLYMLTMISTWVLFLIQGFTEMCISKHNHNQKV